MLDTNENARYQRECSIPKRMLDTKENARYQRECSTQKEILNLGDTDVGAVLAQPTLTRSFAQMRRCDR